MVSLLDLGLIQYFAPAFTFFLILIITWAILEKTSLLGDNKAVNWIIALCMAVLAMLVPGLSDVIQIMTPWFIVLFIFMILLVVIFLFMGVKGDTLAGVFGKNTFVIWVVVIVSLAIVGYSFMQVYGESIQSLTNPEDAEGDLNATIGQILFHPKIMGMVLILVIAGLIVRFVSVSR